MEEGDSNSKNFHISTITQRRHNAIEFLVSHSRESIRDRESIGNAFVDFYSMLFTVDVLDNNCSFQDLLSPVVSRLENETLCSILDVREVRLALLAMGSHKSPGFDGFTPIFFQNILADNRRSSIQSSTTFFLPGAYLEGNEPHFYISHPKDGSGNESGTLPTDSPLQCYNENPYEDSGNKAENGVG